MKLALALAVIVPAFAFDHTLFDRNEQFHFKDKVNDWTWHALHPFSLQKSMTKAKFDDKRELKIEKSMRSLPLSFDGAWMPNRLPTTRQSSRIW